MKHKKRPFAPLSLTPAQRAVYDGAQANQDPSNSDDPEGHWAGIQAIADLFHCTRDVADDTASQWGC